MFPVELAQTLADPEISPAITGGGGFNPTVILFEALSPQSFFAITEIVPPALPEVTVISLVPAPAVMDHPLGMDH